MITQCKNCAGQLVFDPAKQMLVCGHCGGRFKPEEFDVSEKMPLWDKKAVSLNEVYGTDSEEFMDCYVYSCGSCGGEVIINGSEASTKCIYCGNSTVIFNRISRQKRPKYIIPFIITKEEAEQAVRDKLNSGKFVPRKIKRFKTEDVRGIYIPYWIIDCEHKGAVIVKAGGKHTEYYARAGKMTIRNLPLDASKMLSDESSSRLEPFTMEGLKPFDEDYLLGFYSNISDITYGDLRRAANKRTKDYFNELIINSIHGEEKYKLHITDKQKHITAIDYDNMRYAMFPVWFVTYDYNGKHNTILVNGQSGKVVCGVPWNKVLFYTLLIVTGIALTAAAFFVVYPLLKPIGEGSVSGRSTDGLGKILFYLISLAIGLFSTGIANIRKVIKSIKLSQANLIYNFMKKRQG